MGRLIADDRFKRGGLSGQETIEIKDVDNRWYETTLSSMFSDLETTITEITDISTAETDTGLVLKPDGAGGVEWANSYFTGSLTDGAPTNAEIVAILGTAASVGAGYEAVIKDSDGSGLIYTITCDGTNFYYIVGTQAA